MVEFREADAPYPGLRPFESHESEIFFGREAHTDRLLEILQRERFLAVIGPSGSGKSSLVRAGLLPGLAMGGLGTGSDWRIAILRPGDQPIRSLARALLRADVLGHELGVEHAEPDDAEPDPADVAMLEAELRRGPLGLLQVVQAAQTRLQDRPQPFNLLVLVDQFEEIFTYADAGGAKADESEAFVNLLLAARADADSRICVALTMRTDFLGNCVRFADLPEAINRSQYLTPRLTRDEMERALTGPARVFGGDVEPELVVELINAVGQNADQLPLLQHALARMWRVASQRHVKAPLVDWDAAREVGGIGGALNAHANELLKSVQAALEHRHQGLPEQLFRAVTERRMGERGGQDVRRPQTLTRIAQGVGLGDDWQTLVPIVKAFAVPEVCFLQHGKVLNGASVIDLSHEALMRQWDRLASWVADEYQRAASYRRWRERAADHAGGTGSLLTGNDLARAVEWWNPEDSETSGKWAPSEKWAARYRAGDGDDKEFERTMAFIRESRESARVAEAQARQAQEWAEELVNYLAFDLRHELSKIGRPDLVAEIDARVNTYYEQLGETGQPEVQHRQADDLRNTGDRLLDLGKFEPARKAYEQSLAIRKRLVKADASNTEWQRDLSVSYENLGDVEMAAGKLDAARKAYEQSLGIAERLAKADASNTEWQRDLSVSYIKLGELARKEGKPTEALAQFEKSSAIVESLVKSDPNNATWKSDLEFVQPTMAELRRAVSGRR